MAKITGSRHSIERNHLNITILEDVLDAMPRIGWIHRNIPVAGFQYPKNSHNHLYGAVRENPHKTAGLYAGINKTERGGVRAKLKLPVGHGFIAKDQSHRIGRSFHLGIEQLIQRGIRIFEKGLIEGVNQSLSLLRRYNVQFSQARIQVHGHLARHMGETLDKSLRCLPAEESGAKPQSTAEFFIMRGEGPAHIETGDRMNNTLPQISLILIGQHHIKQGIPSCFADEIQTLHQRFERNILVIKRRQGILYNLSEKRIDRGVPAGKHA